MFSFQIAKVEKLSKEQTYIYIQYIIWFILRSRKTIYYIPENLQLMVMSCRAHVEHLAKQEQDTNGKTS